eukprot:GHRR01028144.1.p1 GENE.GHRR01028144.1~~GHRR01028144.1.p1  ORF type:complete len:283 (+),score=46.69 GHRR01028144.1:1122-1970(+)
MAATSWMSTAMSSCPGSGMWTMCCHTRALHCLSCHALQMVSCSPLKDICDLQSALMWCTNHLYMLQLVTKPAVPSMGLNLSLLVWGFMPQANSILPAWLAVTVNNVLATLAGRALRNTAKKHVPSSCEVASAHMFSCSLTYNCLPAGHCAGTANASLPPSPLPSFVHLNMSCNVVAIQKGEVLAIFERAIAAFSRPMDPDHETGDQQVDALKLEPFIDSFITALGLDRGYTVLVVNPKWSASLPSYAYRLGFSDYELQLLNQQVRNIRYQAPTRCGSSDVPS